MTVVVHRRDTFDGWVEKELTGKVDLVIADPPYGGIVNEKWDKLWSIQNQWTMTGIINRVLKPGGTAYVWGGIGTFNNRLFFQWLGAIEGLYDLTIWDVITWRKRRAYGTKNRYLFIREECAMLVKGAGLAKPKTFNIPLLEKKRGYAGYNAKCPAKSEYLRRGNVWDDITEIFKGKIHPTEKPSRLAEVMIETSSNPGELVLDPFAGSGSTGVAAHKLERDCILIEKSGCRMHTIDAILR